MIRKKKVMIYIVAVLVGLFIIGTLTTGTSNKEVIVQGPSLSQRTQEAFLKDRGYSSIAELKADEDQVASLRSINSFEDKGKTTVLVIVDKNMTREEGRVVANNVLTGGFVDGLKDVHVDGPQGAIGWSSVSTKGLTPKE